MIVLYWMTPDPITVTEEVTLLEVWRILRDHGIRRLPVVVGDDQLVGMVGRSDLYRYVTRDAARGPEEGIRAALEGVTVQDAMSTELVTCEVNDPLEEVSEKMRVAKLGAFPVLSRGHLVGIISETDLLGALGELAGLGSGSDRITIRVAEDPENDDLFNIVDLCRRYSLELIAVLTHPILADSAIMTTLRVRGERVDDFVQELWKSGLHVVSRVKAEDSAPKSD